MTDRKDITERINAITRKMAEAQQVISKCRIEMNNLTKELEAFSTTERMAEESPCPYSEIRELFNEICLSFPKIRSIDGSRKKAVHARWEASGRNIYDFEQLFRNAEASDFLKGQNKRSWKATFDWLMNPANFSKVMEGLYAVRTSENKAENNQSSFDLDEWDNFTLGLG